MIYKQILDIQANTDYTCKYRYIQAIQDNTGQYKLIQAYTGCVYARSFRIFSSFSTPKAGSFPPFHAAGCVSMAANAHRPKSSFIRRRTVSEHTIPLTASRFSRLLRSLQVQAFFQYCCCSPATLLLFPSTCGEASDPRWYKMQGFVGVADEKNC